MKRLFTLFFCLIVLLSSAFAQMNWGFRGDIGLEKKIAKGFDAGLEAQYHQTDNFQSTDRWSIGASLSKRLYRNEAKTFNVKASVGFKYLKVYNDWNTKYKGDSTIVFENGLEPTEYINNSYNFNYINTYVDSRQRLTASLQASWELGRLKVSLRETYQFTYTDSVSYTVSKYRFNDGNKDWAEKGYSRVGNSAYYLRNDISGKSASKKNVLRSKVTIDYDIPHWKYDPFVSYELFNGIDDAFKAEKSRVTAGVEFSFKKKHNFELAYMWQNQHDDDEPAGSFICLGYEFSF